VGFEPQTTSRNCDFELKNGFRTSSLLEESIHADNCMESSFLDESLPVGAAGCIRDATGD